MACVVAIFSNKLSIVTAHKQLRNSMGPHQPVVFSLEGKKINWLKNNLALIWNEFCRLT